MVEAYMDESGIHEGAHVCVVAGYWGSKKKWTRFEGCWKEIIKAADEPTLKEFHSTAFWNSKGERHGVFANWSDEKADKFINDLAECIVEAKIFPTSAVLVTEAWKKLNKSERMILTGGYYDLAKKCWTSQGAPNRLYFFPFQFAVVTPAINTRPGLHVHYVFDLNKQFKHHALQLFALLKNDPNLICRHQLGALDFEIGEVAVGLQAADLFAYQSYKFAKERIRRKHPHRFKDLPPLLRKLLTNANDEDAFPFFDEEGLNIALANLHPHMRSAGWKPVKTELRPHAM